MSEKLSGDAKLALFLAAIALIPLRLWSVVTMWRWVMVPLNLPEITWQQSIPISILLGVMAGVPLDLDNDKDRVKRIVGAYVNTGLSTLFVYWMAG